MPKFGWYLVGLIYSLMVWGNFADARGNSWVSPDFLRIAIGLFLFSLAIAFSAEVSFKNELVAPSTPKTKRLALAALIGVAVQFALGAMIRYYHGGLACPGFPNCLDQFLPLPFTTETGLAFAHRWWGVLMLGVFFHLTLETSRNTPALSKLAQRTLGLSIAQIVLGIGTIMSKLEPGSRMSHAAVGYALWGVLFYLNLRTGGIRFPHSNASSIRELRTE